MHSKFYVSQTKKGKIKMIQRYVLSPGVFYSQVADKVFVRNVISHYEYLFNSICKDVLDAFKQERTISEAVDFLGKSYNVRNREEFEKQINDFVQSLVSKGVVRIASSEGVRKWEQPISDVVQELCFKEHRLWQACLELTYRCNERCAHCYLDDPKECCQSELTRDDYFRIIDQLAELGCMNVLVTGGEPTLRPDFIDICKRIVEKGMMLDVFTNALNITDEVFEELCNLHLNNLSFSLYSGTAPFHDEITKIPGSFDKSLRNILMFKARGLDIFIKTMLFHGHFDAHLSLRALCKKIGVTIKPATIMLPGHSGRSQLDMMLDESEIRQLFALEKQDRAAVSSVVIDKTKIRRNMEGPVCSAGKTGLSFAPDGKVYACNTLPIVVGDVRKASVADIWHGSPELEKIRSIKLKELDPKCASCAYSGTCTTCLGSCYQENNRQFRACEYTCLYARCRYEEAF